jgi:hypothetical protein
MSGFLELPWRLVGNPSLTGLWKDCPLTDKNRDFDCERYRLISTDGHPKLAYTALSTSIVCDRRY